MMYDIYSKYASRFYKPFDEEAFFGQFSREELQQMQWQIEHNPAFMESVMEHLSKLLYKPNVTIQFDSNDHLLPVNVSGKHSVVELMTGRLRALEGEDYFTFAYENLMFDLSEDRIDINPISEFDVDEVLEKFNADMFTLGKQYCWGCQKPIFKGKNQCGRCEIARYCGTECFKASWESHKEDCGWMSNIRGCVNSRSKTLIYGTSYRHFIRCLPNQKTLGVIKSLAENIGLGTLVDTRMEFGTFLVSMLHLIQHAKDTKAPTEIGLPPRYAFFTLVQSVSAWYNFHIVV